MGISLKGGPAGGHALSIERLPNLLRVVVVPGGEIDALDQLDDVAEMLETIHVYRKEGEPWRGMWDGQDPKTGRRTGGVFSTQPYVYHDVQPPDEILRHNDRWREWATTNQP